MHIQIDSREKAHAIGKILAEFDRQGIQHFVSKLYVGDYVSLDNPRLVIDRKQNLTEVCQNVCQQHERFRAELIRAREAGIKLIILVEHSPYIRSIDDVEGWENPRKKVSAKAVGGEKLAAILRTIERKYDCCFCFCSKQNTGKEIVRILGESHDA